MLRPDFEAGMRRLCANYSKDLSPEERDAYWAVLQDLAIEDFHAAITEVCASDRQFMPRPGQIRKAAGVGRTAKRSWAQNAAGSAPGDPDRPARLGRNLAEAERAGDSPRVAYYQTVCSNMDARDRSQAEDAYRKERGR